MTARPRPFATPKTTDTPGQDGLVIAAFAAGQAFGLKRIDMSEGVESRINRLGMSRKIIKNFILTLDQKTYQKPQLCRERIRKGPPCNDLG